MKRANQKKKLLKTLLIGLFQQENNLLIVFFSDFDLFAFSYKYIYIYIFFTFLFLLLPCSLTEGYLEKAFIEEK